jgi:hypothetical protein
VIIYGDKFEMKEKTAKGTSGEFENILNDCKERLFKVKST